MLELQFPRPLFTGEHLRPLTACVALDKAAPLELTVALPHFGVLVRIVPPATAHEVTAICVRRGAVAQAPLGAHAACLGVLLAVVGRALDVDQVSLNRLSEALGLLHLEKGGLSQPVGSNHLHVDCFVVLVFQDVADFTELGQRGPAGLGGA